MATLGGHPGSKNLVPNVTLELKSQVQQMISNDFKELGNIYSLFFSPYRNTSKLMKNG